MTECLYMGQSPCGCHTGAHSDFLCDKHLFILIQMGMAASNVSVDEVGAARALMADAHHTWAKSFPSYKVASRLFSHDIFNALLLFITYAKLTDSMVRLCWSKAVDTTRRKITEKPLQAMRRILQVAPDQCRHFKLDKFKTCRLCKIRDIKIVDRLKRHLPKAVASVVMKFCMIK